MDNKKLYRFYCLDCDNAWMEILGEYSNHSKCEYCSKEIECDSVYGDDN